MKPDIDRRQIVLSALATGCLANLTPEALAQARSAARASGLPLLTQASLTRAIPSPSARTYNFEMQAAANDIASYLRTRFTLTASQESFLAALTSADKAQLRQNLLNARARHDMVRVQELQNECGRVRILAGSVSFELQNRGVRNFEHGNFEAPTQTPTQTPQQTPH